MDKSIIGLARNEDFREVLRKIYNAGWKRGVVDSAVWKDGKRYVGAMQKPLSEALKDGPDEASRNFDIANLAIKEIQEALEDNHG